MPVRPGAIMRSRRWMLGWPSLLIAAVLGWMAGAWTPRAFLFLAYVRDAYFSLVHATAMPLVLMVILFSLRQWSQFAAPARRLGRLLAYAFCMMLLASLAGLVLAFLLFPAQMLTPEQQAGLGSLLDAMRLPADPDGPRLPASVYGALADGLLLPGMLAMLLVGLAVARLERESTHTFDTVVEATYRALSRVIDALNLLLPLVVFGVAMSLAPLVGSAGIRALGGLLAAFTAVAALLILVALQFIAWRTRQPLLRVLAALKEPAVVALVTGNPIASVSLAIEAMSAKLGCQRGITELTLPLGAIGLRPGMAVYLAMVSIFVVALYGLSLSAWQIVGVVGVFALSALMSADTQGNFAPWQFRLAVFYLGLPIEMALIVALTLDPLCDGIRNLLNLIGVCALVAWMCETFEAVEQEAGGGPWVLRLSAVQLGVVAVGVLLCGGLVFLLGLGLGGQG
ncbi:hypothetical protein AXA74_17880 [Bordetella hinzii LMG 13501]|nr:hypothetical protein AXA74_17880 [Bordetella hinzii LMG 13501]